MAMTGWYLVWKLFLSRFRFVRELLGSMGETPTHTSSHGDNSKTSTSSKSSKNKPRHEQDERYRQPSLPSPGQQTLMGIAKRPSWFCELHLRVHQRANYWPAEHAHEQHWLKRADAPNHQY
ncbi:hypothetical protein B566_EDAN004729 [Ephemera danica]|nr:hypothetical protein B566_EDAN004729 [Ephemera danica]